MLASRLVTSALPALLSASAIGAGSTRLDFASRRVGESTVILSSHELTSRRGIRRIVGTVVDDSTGIPIGNAAVYLVEGELARGAREVCVNGQGEFGFEVYGDSIALEATARNYEFAHAVVLPFDTVAVMRGRRANQLRPRGLGTPPTLPADDVFTRTVIRPPRQLFLMCD